MASPLESSNLNAERPVMATKQSPEPTNSATPPQSQRNQGSPKESFLEAVKNIFGPCVGVVDVASGYIQNTCRSPSAEGANGAPDNPVLKMTLKKTALNPRLKRRQGETLEFPANGGFDDDVSAISAHTLEEMERLEQLPSASAPGAPSKGTSQPSKSLKKGMSRRQRGTPSHKDLDWTYQMSRQTSDPSIGVSTSGSTSTTEHPSPTRNGEELDSLRLFARAEV